MPDQQDNGFDAVKPYIIKHQMCNCNGGKHVEEADHWDLVERLKITEVDESGVTRSGIQNAWACKACGVRTVQRAFELFNKVKVVKEEI